MEGHLIDFCTTQYFKKVIDKFMDERFADMGISKLEVKYLATLLHNDGISLIELTNIIHMDKANTTRVITALEEKGYVVKHSNEKDSRKYKIFLTSKANNLKDKFVLFAKDLNTAAFKNISTEEKDRFNKTLAKILENLKLL